MSLPCNHDHPRAPAPNPHPLTDTKLKETSNVVGDTEN